jgi:hypothetical protein
MRAVIHIAQPLNSGSGKVNKMEWIPEIISVCSTLSSHLFSTIIDFHRNHFNALLAE